MYLAKVFFLSLVTVPEVTANVNLINFSSCFLSGKYNLLQSRQVKHTPQDSINEMIIRKMNPLVVPVTARCQIQSSISACVMSSEYFTRTLYLVRLKTFEWIKFLRRHLHQIQENGAGRNFITAPRVNSGLITHARMWRSIWNLQLPTESTFE